MRVSKNELDRQGQNGLWRLMLAMAAVVLAVSGCSSSGTETSEAAAGVSSDDVASNGDASSAESASGETEGGDDSQAAWTGPDWIDYPAGYEMTYSVPIDPERGEGAIYGTIPDSTDLPAALDQVLASFEANGHTIRSVRGQYAEVFDATGSVVLVSTRQLDDPPTLNLVFLAPDEAANRGILASSANLEATVGSETFTASGGCTVTETGNTFDSVDGVQSIGFSQREDGTQLVQVLLTAPDGVDYTTTGGDITDDGNSGFTISSGMIGSDGELVEAVVTVDCG